MHKLVLATLLLVGGAAQGQGRHKKLFEAATHSKYQPGFYTLADGTRRAGTLRIWQDVTRNSLQVEQGTAEPLTLRAEELAGFVMGADSFAIARQISLAGQPVDQVFETYAMLKVVLKGTFQVWQHDKLVPAPCGGTLPNGLGGSVPMSGNNCFAHATTWVVRPTPTASLVALPENEQAFAKQAAGIFVDNPPLCQRIRAGLEGPVDFKRIIYAFILKQDIDQVSFERAATIFPEKTGW
jgi:hypothetical protein